MQRAFISREVLKQYPDDNAILDAYPWGETAEEGKNGIWIYGKQTDAERKAKADAASSGDGSNSTGGMGAVSVRGRKTNPPIRTIRLGID